MERWNGGRGSPWSGYCRETVGSNTSSSRSGTIVSRLSTAYTSSGSCFSTFSMEAAMHFDSLGMHEELELGIHEEFDLAIHEELDGDNMNDREEPEEEEEEEEETREDRIRRLVQELFSAPSANCSIKRGDMSVVEKWVILSPKDGASSGKELENDARSWIRSLHQIEQIISSTSLHFRDGTSTKLPVICEEQGKQVGVRCIPGPYNLALVIQETMLKILTFIDIVVAWDPNITEEFLSMDPVMLPPYNKLISLLSVHGVLSEASYKILMKINRSPCPEAGGIENQMTILLLAYENKLGVAIRSTMEKIRMMSMEAIRSTMEKIRMMSMEDGNGLSIPLNPQGSSDIHKVTRSVMMCIRFVRANYSSVDSAIHDKCVPHIENIPPLDNMIFEMLSCLQGKLANISQSISDQGLRSLFLLNNSYFIQDSQHFYYLSDQSKGYMERYLQVSWEPLLSYLLNYVPVCLGKNYSPLSKYESEFEKVYTTQKEWKVPDPGLRRKLRRVIIDKIIPSYKEYIDDNKVTNPKFSPRELEEMLQELFEG